jgi:hypothetical protein
MMFFFVLIVLELFQGRKPRALSATKPWGNSAQDLPDPDAQDVFEHTDLELIRNDAPLALEE